MKKQILFYALLFNLFVSYPEEISVSHYLNQEIEVPSNTNLHLTGSSNVLVNSSVNLLAEDSWLYFDNVRPATVIERYQSSLFIQGQALVVEGNAQVRPYAHGAVVVPHANDFCPLEVFKEKGLSGESRKFLTYEFYRNLEEFDNAIRSFRLKKGYMATFANNSNGTGYSRVFVADSEDVVVEDLPDVLDQTISFIRVFRWEQTSKKGWCGGDPALADKVDATWYYSWSADKVSTPNFQYVPIKQNLGWPGFEEINAKTNVCHLLGYNEPDRSDQSNMTVEEAIAQWPDLLKTGLRLGSPVPSSPGNGNGWLYRFLDKCDSLNYRVDYIVVHAYWGGKSPQNWYKDLKSEYEKCGKRPLWITEWNNGANWTSENWPADIGEQKQKQLSDLKNILNVLDTCSFVERYSIYDWVNEGMVSGQKKTVVRAMIWDGSLTPAGEYYRDNKSVFAFNPSLAHIPTWRIEPPSLSYALDGNAVKLSCEDSNEGLTSKYIVERKINNGAFEQIAEIIAPEKEYTDTALGDVEGTVSYRINLIMKDGTEGGATNEARYHAASGNNSFQYGKAALNNTEWSFFKLKEEYDANPVVIFGVPSNSSIPMSHRVKSIGTTSFQFHLDTWSYLQDPLFEEDVAIGYLALPEGEFDFDGINAQAALVKNVGRSWKSVAFPNSFDEIPAVFVTQTSSRNQYATAVRVCNVTKTGFEVQLQKESALLAESETMTLENLNYIAITPGKGSVDGKKISVGLTAEGVVGTIYSPAKIQFEDAFTHPILFGCMQTTTDDVVSTLRYTNLSESEVRLLRQPELSLGGSPNAGAKEQAAWMVIETHNSEAEFKNASLDDTHIRLSPNPVADILFLINNREPVWVEIFSSTGGKVRSEQAVDCVNLKDLKKGLYFVKIESRTYKVLKN